MFIKNPADRRSQTHQEVRGMPKESKEKETKDKGKKKKKICEFC